MSGKTGKLESGAAGYYICIDCQKSYPKNTDIEKDGLALCNGHIIDLCPWCRPDTQPWRNGRGI